MYLGFTMAKAEEWGQPVIELGNIMILAFIVILKCHDNQYQREILSIIISPAQYYR